MAMLEIKNIHKSFRTYDEKPHFHIGPFPRGHARRVIRTLDVLRGVDLTVEKGDVVAILGPSGSGKTTLLRCLNFLEPTDSGSLTFDGETFDLSRISSADIARLRKKTAFVFQNYNLFRNKTALQNAIPHLRVAYLLDYIREKTFTAAKTVFFRPAHLRVPVQSMKFSSVNLRRLF